MMAAANATKRLLSTQRALTGPFRPFSQLVDTFQRKHDYLRISLTEKCNLRCQYCMPEEGVPLAPESLILTRPQIDRLAKIFASQGVTKVRLTGGEPLVRREIIDIVADLSQHFSQIGITTNGTLVTRKLERLKAAGLSHLNISLDSLVPSKNEFITRRPDTSQHVLRAIDKALEIGLPSVKLNVVAMRNFNDDEFLDFIELTKERPIDVRFIEFMPFDQNDWKNKKFISMAEMQEKVELQYGSSISRILGEASSSTSKGYQIEGYQGQYGYISSMSKHFCGGCNRLRLTADGHLKVCLFDNREVNLKEMLERNEDNDSEVVEVIKTALGKKHFTHGGVDSILQRSNRPMVKIGG